MYTRRGVVYEDVNLDLAPGEVAAVTGASGSGRTALLLTLAGGLTLIPQLGLAGAGLTSSISYTLSALFQLAVFKKKEKLPLKRFLLTRDDLQFLLHVIRRQLFIKSQDV